ncbi:MAG: hypothetical protein GFH27_549323n147 [Chloroflexi bacterium AL-W]|nr:hypothetical protein [Chloroflexi bacterium AL-N1]NOK70298.1 hypothetical protein [Chloroflexi bacterium AL-N10]NOK77835.1 hypothetical protein [Chloroflexi bacterium AL-N5]NOK84844.1 hypothetical protein [Chloroflexi bacterium AL-W]NOK92451.1 hypothetical protein [Chloroflexi bacterium AL-N15]
MIQISPDNKTLLLQVEADNQQYNLQLATIDGGKPQIIAENSGTISAASWSPRNDTIALFNQQEWALQLYDIDTDTLDTIVSVSDSTVWNIIWDSAGENVIFTTGTAGAEQLNRFDVTTSTEYLLTDLPGSLTQLIATLQ